MHNIETYGSLFAAVALPTYMGWNHFSLLVFCSYIIVAGMALAAGERLTVDWLAGADGLEFASYATLRVVYVAIAGGLTYALALWLI